MSTIKVHVMMDESWQWWLVPEGETYRPLTLEISQELYDEFKSAQGAYSSVQEKLEQLYRAQEGLEPWHNATIPEHKVLESKT